MKNLYLMCLLALFSARSVAQIIYTDPTFPTQDDVVTLFYDASEGNGDVAGVIPLYIHTGVITTNSVDQSDWQHVVGNWGTNDAEVIMTAEGGNIYSFDFGGLTLAEFYNLDMGEDILDLAMVFRNANGSLVGRESDGGDIYFPITDGSFTASIASPTTNSVAINDDENIDFVGQASELATMSYAVNDVEVISASDVTELEWTFSGYPAGEYTVELIADNGGVESISERTVIVIPELQIQDAPEGTLDGINYIDDTTVILRVFAPEKENIFVIGDFNDWQLGLDYQMSRSVDGNTYWVEITGLTPDQEYRFHYNILPGNIRVGDAYAEKYLDKWHDPWIPEENYPNLMEFPDGLTSNEPVSILQTAQTPFDWTDNDFERPTNDKLVIYELLVRDFSEERTFDFITDTLDYIESLGVNAIELMPFVEFNGNDSWGYNNSMYFAPDKYYGTKESIQNFVNEAHNRGIAVILDIAFNHADLPNPFLRMYWDEDFGDFGAPATNNPWFNQTAPHDLTFFFDWDHEAFKTKEFVKRFMDFWLEEYHLDGWRWDFTQGMTQTNTLGSWAGNYDQSRIDILNEYAYHIWNDDPSVYMILEHWTDNAEETALANNGFMLWGNVCHEFQEASMGYASDFQWASYQNRGWNDPHLITYLESHDEERLMYKNFEFGNSNGDYDITEMTTALERIEMSYVFHTSIPGPKMIWQFAELGYDYSINYCPDGTINDDCRVSAKPVRWDYREDADRYKVYQVMAAVNKLKISENAFSTTDFNLDAGGTVKRLHLNHPEMNVVVLGNFDVTGYDVVPGFQNMGTWYDYFTGESFEVTDLNASQFLTAGEYHIYTNVALETPDTGNAVAELTNDIQLSVYPNPFESTIQLTIADLAGELAEVRLIDQSGRELELLFNGRIPTAKTVIDLTPTSSLSQGYYFVTLSGDFGTHTIPVVKK
ncbi:MAG: alpha-amylase family glycosyl hydrolase [Flavobacteriales bacterium]|nr:alpha-amylase family glycosyl hydrolase [Flavobacteriales bacterium]